jgi:Domain of unknown function (DUF5615)
MDVHVPRAITQGLRPRDVDVLTAQEDGARQLCEAELLDRASALGRVLFTRDVDLLAEARRRQGAGHPFGGVLRATTADSEKPSCGRRSGAAPGWRLLQTPLPPALSQGINRESTRAAKNQRHQASDV